MAKGLLGFRLGAEIILQIMPSSSRFGCGLAGLGLQDMVLGFLKGAVHMFQESPELSQRLLASIQLRRQASKLQLREAMKPINLNPKGVSANKDRLDAASQNIGI